MFIRLPLGGVDEGKIKDPLPFQNPIRWWLLGVFLAKTRLYKNKHVSIFHSNQHVVWATFGLIFFCLKPEKIAVKFAVWLWNHLAQYGFPGWRMGSQTTRNLVKVSIKKAKSWKIPPSKSSSTFHAGFLSTECNTSTTKLQYTKKNTQNAMLMIRDDAGGTRYLKIDNFFWTPQTMKNAGFKP